DTRRRHQHRLAFSRNPVGIGAGIKKHRNNGRVTVECREREGGRAVAVRGVHISARTNQVLHTTKITRPRRPMQRSRARRIDIPQHGGFRAIGLSAARFLARHGAGLPGCVDSLGQRQDRENVADELCLWGDAHSMLLHPSSIAPLLCPIWSTDKPARLATPTRALPSGTLSFILMCRFPAISFPPPANRTHSGSCECTLPFAIPLP